MANTKLKKNAKGYGYTYTDLAEIHNYLEANGMAYRQYIEPVDGTDYIMTVPIVNGEERSPIRGCRVVEAKLSGKSNPVQEYGASLTYCRRYSLLMAFGLATTDDDAESLTVPEHITPKRISAKHASEIKAILEETDSNVPAFLSIFRAESVDDMFESQYEDAMAKLEQKRQKIAQKGDK